MSKRIPNEFKVEVKVILHNADRMGVDGCIQPGMYLVDPSRDELSQAILDSGRDGYAIVWVRYSNCIEFKKSA